MKFPILRYVLEVKFLIPRASKDTRNENFLLQFLIFNILNLLGYGCLNVEKSESQNN